MGGAVSGTNHLVQRILDGAVPGYPNIHIPFVDVRDVAAAHLLAMTEPGAAGERFLISSGPAIPLKRVGALLRESLGDAAARVPTRSIPDAVVRLGAVTDRELRALVPDLGYVKKPANDKARRVLGWQPRRPDEAIVAAARSMIGDSLIDR